MISKIKKILNIENSLLIDNLTKLPNREGLLDDIDCIDKTLFLLNIDGFKEINDFYGNKFGNNILKNIADELVLILKESFHRKAYTLYKMPADEYAILFNKKFKKEILTDIANKIQYNFERKMFGEEEYSIYISLTIGIGFINKTDNLSHNLLSNANMALKEAKKYKKSFIIFDKESNQYKEYENNLMWTKKIKEAIEEDRIKSFFQPIYNNETKKIEKYESLMRLIDIDGKVSSPFLFLDISKKNRLYYKLTKIIIDNSFKIVDETDYEVSINLSTQDIMNPDIRDFIYERLSKINNPSKIVFEILESEGIDNYELASEFISKSKEYGVKIAIDDFGSGFSNFDYILKLNVDFLKIDGSLIKNINHDKNTEIIVETIVSFCKKMNIKTVAEFVSSKEVYDKVNELGVDYSQGYYIGKPEDGIINTQEK